MNKVKFERHGRVHCVDSEIASLLLTSTLGALSDIVKGRRPEQSLNYLAMQRLLTTHVYAKGLDAIDDHIDGIRSVITEPTREVTDRVPTHRAATHRAVLAAYLAMTKNMSPRSAIIRLSERYGLATKDIEELLQ